MSLKRAFVLSLFLLTVCFFRSYLEKVYPVERLLSASCRIASLSPSITESLYALGLGRCIVGVTSFCTYPPEACSKSRIGGFGNVNVEAVLRAGANLAVVPSDQVEIQKALRAVGISVIAFDSRTLSGFLRDIALLGEKTSQSDIAKNIVGTFHKAFEKAYMRSEGRVKPEVLFVVMHSHEDKGARQDVSVVGRDGFYDELIFKAGGVNAYQGRLAFPRLSYEAVIRLNPDVIIDAVPLPQEQCEEYMRSRWLCLNELKAVKNKRVYIFNEASDTIPCVRSLKTLEKLSDAFFPKDMQ